jgi:hypothetical protein
MVSPPMALMGKRDQRINTRLGFDNHTPTVTSIAATWATARYVLLASKRHAAIPTSTRDHFNFHTINKHDYSFS